MRFFKIQSILLFTAFLGFAHSSCKEQATTFDKKKEYIDSLEIKTVLIDNALNGIRAQDLQKRIALINTWYITLKDTSYDVAKKMQVDFNGFKVVYQRYIDNYFSYEAESEVLKEQILSFKKAAKNESQSREEFKKQYADLKLKANTLHSKVLKLTKPVNDLAFSWRRYKKQMEHY
jgi:hypothetical protein